MIRPPPRSTRTDTLFPYTTLFRSFDYFTTGDPAQEEAVAIANEASRVKSYGLVNAQVSFTLRDPEIEFTVWGKNLANTPWFTNVFNSYTGLGATVQYQGAPRTYGARVSLRFCVQLRSEERRVGKECVSTCRIRLSPFL